MNISFSSSFLTASSNIPQSSVEISLELWSIIVCSSYGTPSSSDIVTILHLRAISVSVIGTPILNASRGDLPE